MNDYREFPYREKYPTWWMLLILLAILVGGAYGKHRYNLYVAETGARRALESK